MFYLLLESPVDPNIRCTYFQNVLLPLGKGRSGFQRLCFKVKNENSDLKSLTICKAGMPSISIIPNKNVKWTETAMVSRCLKLTVIAVFGVMGNSISISSSEIQCPANPRYQCIQPPCCGCPFSVAAIKNQLIQSQNVIHSIPIPFPVTVFPASPEEHVTMVTNPSGAQTKSTFLVRLPGRVTQNQSPG